MKQTFTVPVTKMKREIWLFSSNSPKITHIQNWRLCSVSHSCIQSLWDKDLMQGAAVSRAKQSCPPQNTSYPSTLFRQLPEQRGGGGEGCSSFWLIQLILTLERFFRGLRKKMGPTSLILLAWKSSLKMFQSIKSMNSLSQLKPHFIANKLVWGEKKNNLTAISLRIYFKIHFCLFCISFCDLPSSNWLQCQW